MSVKYQKLFVGETFATHVPHRHTREIAESGERHLWQPFNSAPSSCLNTFIVRLLSIRLQLPLGSNGECI
jgi:hypothetical protein